MSTTTKTIFALSIIIIISTLVYTHRSSAPVTTMTETSIVGCYVATLGKDVYTLTITSQQNNAVAGTLQYKNFEKDSSSGSFMGTFSDNTLLGEYTFNSEGMQSVRQVIFKHEGDTFIQGFGVVETTGDREHFANTALITYDKNSTFKHSDTCDIR